MPRQTEGERHFENWATQHGIRVKRVRTGKGSRPDYWVRCSEGACLLEVKDLEPNNAEQEFDRELGAKGIAIFRSTPGERLERRIKEAGRKYARWKVRVIPCVTLVFNNTRVLSSTSSLHVYAGMFGRIGLSVSMLQEDEVSVTNENGVLRPDRNTSTSAIAALEWGNIIGYTIQLYHNPFAANPLLPQDISELPGIRQFRIRAASDFGSGLWIEYPKNR